MAGISEDNLGKGFLKNRQFNNEVQHLGKQKGKCYPKWLWKNTSN